MEVAVVPVRRTAGWPQSSARSAGSTPGVNFAVPGQVSGLPNVSKRINAEGTSFRVGLEGSYQEKVPFWHAHILSDFRNQQKQAIEILLIS